MDNFNLQAGQGAKRASRAGVRVLSIWRNEHFNYLMRSADDKLLYGHPASAACGTSICLSHMRSHTSSEMEKVMVLLQAGSLLYQVTFSHEEKMIHAKLDMFGWSLEVNNSQSGCRQYLCFSDVSLGQLDIYSVYIFKRLLWFGQVWWARSLRSFDPVQWPYMCGLGLCCVPGSSQEDILSSVDLFFIVLQLFESIKFWKGQSERGQRKLAAHKLSAVGCLGVCRALIEKTSSSSTFQTHHSINTHPSSVWHL